MKRWAAVGVVMLSLLAACGGGGSSRARDLKYAEAAVLTLEDLPDEFDVASDESDESDAYDASDRQD